MPMKFDDRGRETNTAPGTGNFPAGTAVQGAISLATFLTATGHYTTYEADNGIAWETGILTRQSDGSYARTVKRSTNSNAAVDFSTGTVSVCCDAPAWLFDHLNMIEETVTSAATFDIGASQALRILASGTTGPVTSFGTTPNKLRIVRWAGSILTHNATTLILLGGLSRTTATGDIGIYVSDASGNWRELSYQRADGHPLATGHSTIASATTTELGSVLGQSIIVSGTTTITGFGSTAPTGAIKSVDFSGALLLTYNATSLILPGAANITTVAGDCAIFRHEGSGNWRCLTYAPAASSPYKEGTWTPVLTFGTPGNLSVAYSAQVGSYTKVGKLVTITFNILTSAFTHTTASGDLTFTGLPFTCNNVANERWRGTMQFQGITKAGYTNYTCGPIANTTTMLFIASGSGVGIATVTAADMPTGGAVIIQGSVTYMATS